MSFTDSEMADLLAVFERGSQAGLFGAFTIAESRSYEPVSKNGSGPYMELSRKIALSVFPPDSESAIFVFHKNATGSLGPLYNCVASPAKTLPPPWTRHFGIALSRFNQAVENKIRLLQQSEQRFREGGNQSSFPKHH